jgi:hypothetical protein
MKIERFNGKEFFYHGGIIQKKGVQMVLCVGEGEIKVIQAVINFVFV